MAGPHPRGGWGGSRRHRPSGDRHRRGGEPSALLGPRGAPDRTAPSSSQLGRPAALAVQVLRPPLTAMGDVLTVGDQPLVQVAGEQGDAAGGGMVAAEMTGETDPPAAAGDQHGLIEPRPILDGLLPGGLDSGGGDRHHSGSCERTPVLAREGVLVWSIGSGPGPRMGVPPQSDRPASSGGLTISIRLRLSSGAPLGSHRSGRAGRSSSGGTAVSITRSQPAGVGGRSKCMALW